MIGLLGPEEVDELVNESSNVAIPTAFYVCETWLQWSPASMITEELR